MTVASDIESKLRDGLEPQQLEVQNESHMHNVPPGSESHFRVLVVSERFAGLPRLKRHRTIHSLLHEELTNGLHALAIDALTPAEWQRRGETAGRSPACRGGSKQG